MSRAPRGDGHRPRWPRVDPPRRFRGPQRASAAFLERQAVGADWRSRCGLRRRRQWLRRP